MPGLTAQDYVLLPWSIRGPIHVADEHGNAHYEMRIAELPDFFVAGETESEVLYEFKKALLAFLESYTADGEVPPIPHGEPVEYAAFVPGRNRAPGSAVVREAPATAGTQPATVALGA